MQVWQGEAGVDRRNLWLGLILRVQGLGLCPLDTLHHFGASPVGHHAAVAGYISWHALFLRCPVDRLDGTDAVCVVHLAIGRVEELSDVLVRL